MPWDIIADYARPNALHHPQLLIRADGASPLSRVRGNGSVGNPDIDQRLHWLHILLRQQAEELGDGNEVHEARIEIRPAIGVGTAAHVPERVDPVGVVEVGVQAEDLTEAGLDVAVEGLWKTGALAEPVAACERGEGGGGGGGACCDRGVRIGGVEAAGGVGRGAAGDVVGGKGFGVVHPSDDPALD